MKKAADPSTLFQKGGAALRLRELNPHGRAAWAEREDAIERYDAHSEAACAALARAKVTYPDAPEALALPFREGLAVRNGALARQAFMGSGMGSPSRLAVEAGESRVRDR